MDTVVVAGATGYLGRHLVVELARRGYAVRAVVRSRQRAEDAGPFGSPSLRGSVAEWAVGEITDEAFVTGVCAGADRVASALGVTRQKASPWDVDFLANLHLLQDAEREGLASFLYVNVLHAGSGRSLIMRSKAAFAAVLQRSSLAHQVVNPSGYFSDLSDFTSMARSGLMVLPPAPGVRVSPIHGADLARFCVDHLGDESGNWDVGGPDALTYPEIGRLALAAAGRKERMVTLPKGVLSAAVWVASRLGERPGDLAQFFAEGLTQDAVAEPFGEHHLADHFAGILAAPRKVDGSAAS